jgi:hypothetical protein
MISVLICSIDTELLNNVRTNIAETIGVPFEILYLDNRNEKKGICQVYNELAERARFPYLCFLHEDVILNANDWGKEIENIFLTDLNIGLIGIAGCKYKSAYFSGWFSNNKKLDCANYIHRYKNKDIIEKVHLSPSDNNDLQEVVCIDGVFMSCTKKAWDETRFDSSFLKGFHFYDVDFSLRLARHYKVVVTYDIELVHITSGGDYGNAWVEIAIVYHQKMKSSLPYSKIGVDQTHADKNVVIAMADFLKNYKITFGNKIKWIFLQKLYLSPKFYYSILKFFLFSFVRIKRTDN